VVSLTYLSHRFLICQANRGILYVDEVNLLDDHLVDVLLDSAVNYFSFRWESCVYR